MAVSRKDRDYKKKMGQFMTPQNISKRFIGNREYINSDKVLEPSFGEGSFLVEIIDRFLEINKPSSICDFVTFLLEDNIYGVELDSNLYNKTLDTLSNRYGVDISKINHNLYNLDFFTAPLSESFFNYIEGNPPFGGSFDEEVGIKLDKVYGKYKGIKIKKETYSFFTHKCYNMLAPGGSIGFVCSDTFMSIPTMKGIPTR